MSKVHFQLLLILLLATSLTLSAQHTFSIVAIDTVTGEIGSAGATCLTSDDCRGCGGAVIISGILPGRAGINAQAQVCLPNKNLEAGIKLASDGYNAYQILESLLTDDQCDVGTSLDRQYGIITYRDGRPSIAAYTGENTLSESSHRIGQDYAIQGNILIDEYVLDAMELAFRVSDKKPLATRLMSSLSAANIIGADRRCLADGFSSRSSYLQLASPDDDVDSLSIDIQIKSPVDGLDPIDILATELDAVLGLSSNVNAHSDHITLKILVDDATNSLTIEIADNKQLNGTYEWRMDVMRDEKKLRAYKIVKATQSFDISDLSEGLYTLDIYKDGRIVQSRKFLKL